MHLGSQEDYIESIVDAITENFEKVDTVVKKCEDLKNLRKEYYQAMNESRSSVDKVLRLIKEYTQKAQIKESLVQKLQHDIGYYCDGYKSIEPLSVGLFGEWGSGKTRLLKGIQYKINTQQEANIALWESTQKKLDIDEDEPLTIPVFFNAWRFEKEGHIILPLFKTLVSTLSSYEHISRTHKIHSKLRLLSLALVKGLQFPSIDIDQVPQNHTQKKRI